jgi:plasmid stabilization system protein ParE
MRSGSATALHEGSLPGACACRHQRDSTLPGSAKSQRGSKVLQAIRASIRAIADRPYASQRTTDPDVRVKVVRPFRYKIFYSVMDNNTVEIMHVRHTSRGPWKGQTG